MRNGHSDHKRRKEDLRHGIAGWWLRPARRGWIAVLFLMTIAIVVLQDGYQARVARDERTTCLIQRHAIDANRYLTAFLRTADLPDGIVANRNLTAYLQIEASLPPRRGC